jgi:hypothetical protein
VRKPPPAGPTSSPRRLTFALLCAFAGCLNPRPEEYPSGNASPEAAEAAGAPTADNPARQGGDNFEPNATTGPSGDPDSDQPIEPPLAPGFVAPPAADAGVDAGDAGVDDAGAPAIAD